MSLDEKKFPFKELGQLFHELDVKAFLKKLEQYVTDCQMYADMDEPEFWASSTINQEDANKRANYLWEFIEFIKKEAGDDLI